MAEGGYHYLDPKHETATEVRYFRDRFSVGLVEAKAHYKKERVRGCLTALISECGKEGAEPRLILSDLMTLLIEEDLV